MKKYLINKKEEIKEIDVKKRNIKFPISKNFIISIIGPRRAGKTYSLYNLIKTNNFAEEDYIFINFEDYEIKNLEKREIAKCVFYHQEIYGKQPKFLFFDEIQNLENWESFVYSLFEKKKYYIFLTGSSSKLLSKEIATQLRGRSLSILVLPFSFKEILMLENIEIADYFSSYTESKIKYLLRNYLANGGFPDIVLTNINRKTFFRDYISLVVFRDIVERYRIKNVFLIKTLISSILPLFSKEFSIHKIYNFFKSKGIKVSKKTLYKYTDFLQDVFFCFFLRKFSFSEREFLLSIPKLYFNDLGLINYALSTNFSENLGRLMENAVFLELKKKEYAGEICEIFYWKDYQGKEVDFVIKEGLRIKQLIQVTYASDRDEIEQREIKSLLKAFEIFKKDKPELLIITWDYETEEEFKGRKIKFLPLWKWLLKI